MTRDHHQPSTIPHLFVAHLPIFYLSADLPIGIFWERCINLTLCRLAVAPFRIFLPATLEAFSEIFYLPYESGSVLNTTDPTHPSSSISLIWRRGRKCLNR